MLIKTLASLLAILPCLVAGAAETTARRPNIVLILADGYQTAIVGKWHLVSDPTGFDYWHILPGQGQYHEPPMIDNGTPTRHKGYTTDVITDLSLDWLKERRDADRPFLLMCQQKAPHREWEPSTKYLADDDREYPEPDTLFDDYSSRGVAERNQDMTISRTMNDRDLKLTPPATLTPEERERWDAYYGPRNDWPAFNCSSSSIGGDETKSTSDTRHCHFSEAGL